MTIRMRQLWALVLLLTFTVTFTSCKKDDEDKKPEIPNEEEVITTVTMNLVNEADASDVVNFVYKDLDGEGSGKPVITGGELKANSTYKAVLTLLNETESPAENVTEEIEEEAKDHQFFFESKGGLNLSVAYGDKDADGNPIGLISSVTTKEASTGELTVTLKHEPNKSGDGVKDGKIANAGGEIDVEATFPVTIK